MKHARANQNVFRNKEVEPTFRTNPPIIVQLLSRVITDPLD